jgi:hypothetical protein
MLQKLPKVNQKQIPIVTIRHMGELPKAPDGDKYTFKPASTADQARGVCNRYGAPKGYWLKNRVYFLPADTCTQLEPSCRCLDPVHPGDNPDCPEHGSKKAEPA